MIRFTVIGLVGTVVLAVLAASVVLQGSRLGRLIESTLPENKGKIHIGGVTWRLRALADIVTDEPTPITVDGLQIVDPEGTVVLDVPHLDAKVKLRTLIAGGSFSIHDLRVPVALWRFAAMKNSEGIGFLAALAPKKAPPPPPPDAKPKGPGSFFAIEGAELGDLNAILDFPGSWGLELRHAHARASLKQDGTDPEHPTFGFDAGPVLAAGGGWLRILDDFVLPFDRVDIARVATTQEWSDDIFLDLTEADTGRTKLVGKGFFTGIYGEKSIPGIKLHAGFTQAGDALTAVVAGGGLKIEGLTISGRRRRDQRRPHRHVRRIEGEGRVQGARREVRHVPGAGHRLRPALRRGGRQGRRQRLRVRRARRRQDALGAKLDINTLALDANLAFTDFHTESYVPPELRAMAGGRLRAHRRAGRHRAQVGAPAARRSEVHAPAGDRPAEGGAHQRQRACWPPIASRPTG